MPWSITDEKTTRRAFIEAVLIRRSSFVAVCRRFGISRKTGYKWWERFSQSGAKGLANRSRRPKRASWLQARWRDRVLRLRRQYRSWGAIKLRVCLQRRFPRGRVPAVSTVERWLRAAGLVRRYHRRAKRGPRLHAPQLASARQPNDVWTIDFKGAFCTSDRRRSLSLTVRDLASRYVLAVRQVAQPTDRIVRAALTRLFRRYGLPRAIQVDNGSPFGGSGPLGLSRLSVWWLRLGLQVNFSRPASPQDNAAHEQMHAVLKRDTARPPAANLIAQQQRFDRWRKLYNEVRPHQALQHDAPARHYRPSPRRFPNPLPTWSYPAGRAVLVPGPNGRAWWCGRQRFIGRAFAGETLALQHRNATTADVFLGPWLIGTLHADDHAGLRPTQWTRACR